MLVFRDQDFEGIGMEKQKETLRHLGRCIYHGWAPHPGKGRDEHMIIYDHRECVSFRHSLYIRFCP